MKNLKIFSLILLSVIMFTNQSCSGEKKELKDAQLSSFMLGGIYFINGYGGTSEVQSMMDGAGYTSNEELVSGYKEIFEFPFQPAEASGSKRVLKQAWDITNKETLLSAIEELQTEDSKHKAWDFARIANNACIGYSAGYLTKEEVYPILTETLKLAQTKYKNWDEYYTDFDLGRKDWDPENSEEDTFGKLANEITKREKSIYKILPLNNL